MFRMKLSSANYRYLSIITVSFTFFYLVFCQGCNRTPVDVTIEQVCSRQIKQVSRIRLPLVLLPHTIVRYGEEPCKDHYMLAVAKDSAYLKTLKSVQSELEGLFTITSDPEKLLTDEDECNKALDTYNKAVETIVNLPNSDDLRGLVVCLKDFDSKKFNIDWEPILMISKRRMKVSYEPLHNPLISSPEQDDRADQYKSVWSEMKERIQKERKEIELRQNLARQLPQFVANMYFQIEVICRDCGHTLIGKPIKPERHVRASFAYLFEKIRIHMLIETNSDEESFGKLFYKTTNLLVSTEPSGLSVTVNGKSAGVSPCLISKLEPNSSCKIIIADDKGKTLEKSVPLRSEIMNVTQAHIKFNNDVFAHARE